MSGEKSTNSTEERLTSLERFAEAVTNRQHGEDQLQEGVSRLSDETNSLHTILSRVDEQQQYLASLDKRTEMVEETAVSRDELIRANDHQEQEAFEFRKKTLKRITLTGLLMALAIVTSVIGFHEWQSNNNKARNKVCLERNEQTDILLDILRGVDSSSGKTPAITEGIKRLEAKIVDCEALL
jgi:hypothetical protein